MNAFVKAVFDDECAKLEIGPKLVKRLNAYQEGFVNKNEEHIQFFGGKLLGVQVVRFTEWDKDKWFNEILEVVEEPLADRLLALPTINAEFHVSSNTMNLSCVWLAHAIFISKNLSDQEKHAAMIDIFLVLQYKYLTSRLTRHFQYPADPATAEATYAQLSYKFDIKVYGNWHATLRARAEAIIAKTSIHYHTIATLDDDFKVVYMLNDTQGRIRDMLKVMYNVFINVHNNKIRISTTSAVVEHDGVAMLKDKTQNLLAYGRYINSIITDKNSFIREELMSIVENLMHTMSPKLFRETLIWMSSNYRQNGAGLIEEVLNETLIHSFDYLSHNRDLVRNVSDIGGLLSKLRGVYMSSRSTDPVLFSLRGKAEKIVKQATRKDNVSIIASVRTGVLLYIVLRAMTMKHYTAQ
jgi:hypothetical protein